MCVRDACKTVTRFLQPFFPSLSFSYPFPMLFTCALGESEAARLSFPLHHMQLVLIHSSGRDVVMLFDQPTHRPNRGKCSKWQHECLFVMIALILLPAWHTQQLTVRFHRHPRDPSVWFNNECEDRHQESQILIQMEATVDHADCCRWVHPFIQYFIVYTDYPVVCSDFSTVSVGICLLEKEVRSNRRSKTGGLGCICLSHVGRKETEHIPDMRESL